MFHKDVTIAIIATDRTELDAEAVTSSAERFAPERVIVLSDKEDGWKGLPVVKISKFKSGLDYGLFIARDLHRYIDTQFVIIIQYDGFILNAQQFSPHFYFYDYIGAPWPNLPYFRVGNGGFSWRSKRLLEAESSLLQEFVSDGSILSSFAEDTFICRTMRVELETRFGINFAGEDLASHFSVEAGTRRFPTFGFHGVWHLVQVYADRLDWLLQHLPDRILDNHLFATLIRNELGKVSKKHRDRFKRARLARQGKMLGRAWFGSASPDASF